MPLSAASHRRAAGRARRALTAVLATVAVAAGGFAVHASTAADQPGDGVITHADRKGGGGGFEWQHPDRVVAPQVLADGGFEWIPSTKDKDKGRG